MEEAAGRSRAAQAAPRLRASLSRAAALVPQARRLRRLAAAALPPGRRAAFDDPPEAPGEHIVVRDVGRRRVVGACRLLPPEAARDGGYATERYFDLALLAVLRERMVEVTDPCVDPAYPGEEVIALLWARLARYLVENRHDYVIACVALSIADGGDAAASCFRALGEERLSPVDLRVAPRHRLPLEALRDHLPIVAPPLLRAYLDLGAWVCGEPALDLESGHAILPVLLPLARMRGRYARNFLTRAA